MLITALARGGRFGDAEIDAELGRRQHHLRQGEGRRRPGRAAHRRGQGGRLVRPSSTRPPPNETSREMVFSIFRFDQDDVRRAVRREVPRPPPARSSTRSASTRPRSCWSTASRWPLGSPEVASPASTSGWPPQTTRPRARSALRRRGAGGDRPGPGRAGARRPLTDAADRHATAPLPSWGAGPFRDRALSCRWHPPSGHPRAAGTRPAGTPRAAGQHRVRASHARERPVGGSDVHGSARSAPSTCTGVPGQRLRRARERPVSVRRSAAGVQGVLRARVLGEHRDAAGEADRRSRRRRSPTASASTAELDLAVGEVTAYLGAGDHLDDARAAGRPSAAGCGPGATRLACRRRGAGARVDPRRGRRRRRTRSGTAASARADGAVDLGALPRAQLAGAAHQRPRAPPVSSSRRRRCRPRAPWRPGGDRRTTGRRPQRRAELLAADDRREVGQHRDQRRTAAAARPASSSSACSASTSSGLLQPSGTSALAGTARPLTATRPRATTGAAAARARRRERRRTETAGRGLGRDHGDTISAPAPGPSAVLPSDPSQPAHTPSRGLGCASGIAILARCSRSTIPAPMASPSATSSTPRPTARRRPTSPTGWSASRSPSSAWPCWGWSSGGSCTGPSTGSSSAPRPACCPTGSAARSSGGRVGTALNLHDAAGATRRVQRAADDGQRCSRASSPASCSPSWRR